MIDNYDIGDVFYLESNFFFEYNIKGIFGRNLYGFLGILYEIIKEDSCVFWIDKCYYFVFFGIDLDICLCER